MLRMVHSASHRFGLCSAALLLLAAGCADVPPIAVYTVQKAQLPQTDRMLGAIVPRDGQAWFFKVTGPEAEVKQIEAPFEDFVRAVRFRDATAAFPEWDLPEGWKQLPGDQLRFATLQIPAPSGRTPLEIAVSSLPWRGDEESQLVANINRWRGQMSLPRLGRSQLDQHVKRVESQAGKALLVNLVGALKASKGPGMMAPGNAPGLAAPNRPAPSASSSDEGLKYAAPASWTKSAGNSLSAASFEVVDGTRKLEITVTPLAANAGQLVPNINRWRGQIGLAEASEAEIRQALQKLPMGDIEADYIEIRGDGQTAQAIFGAIAVSKNASWFVKLRGDAALADREKQPFQEFVKSIRLP